VNYSWTADASLRRRHEGAMSDVLAGMTLIGAAAVWGVQVTELQRLVDEARAAEQAES
jgi:hypothetical protein